MSNLYEMDFYAWTQEQAELLRLQEWQKLDLANLIEEVESLGKQQRQELRNGLSILIGHLLKWEYQREWRSRSWLATIRVQRRDLLRLMRDNPSLKPYLLEVLPEAYENGKDLAVMETNLPYKTFPSVCGYVWEDILSDRFFPGEPSIELEEEF